MCGCECCISPKSMNLSLLSCYERLKKIKHQILHTQNRRSGEIANQQFETYKKSMFKTAYDMSMAKMRAYPSSKYARLH